MPWAIDASADSLFEGGTISNKGPLFSVAQMNLAPQMPFRQKV